jgi:hypothetical protein
MEDHPAGACRQDRQLTRTEKEKGEKTMDMSPTAKAMRSLGQNAEFVTVSTITTAAAVTYTAAQVIGGLILRDPNGAGRSDVLPTAALLAAALPGCVAGSSVDVLIRNDADAAETITMTAGTGGTVTGGGTMTVAQSAIKCFKILFTNVTPGSEAYTVYSLGTLVF